jgi:hypothetical protein
MNKTIRAALCILVGAAILIVSAVIDHRTSQGPWQSGFAFIGPANDIPGLVQFVEYLPPAADSQFTEWSSHKILFIDFDDNDWASILAEGEVPDPEKREALAGSLCGPEEIVVNGETYRVTGRLHRVVGSLSTVYLIPFDAAVTDSLIRNNEGNQGFYLRKTQLPFPEDNFEWPEDVSPLFPHHSIAMPTSLSFAVLAGLALTLYGAAVLQWSAVLWLHRISNAFDGLVTAGRKHPQLFRFVLTLNYTTFLYMMFAGILFPQANLAATQWAFEQFSDGALKELGQAYDDGNIPLAAWETFRNNFIVQTVILAAIPSLFIPLFGVGKTLLSLIVVGFPMAPVWTGGALPMTFHWITIALELQAYILVSFGVSVYTVRAWKALVVAFREPDDELPSAKDEFLFGFEALASATMYACLALAIGALYEAVTLIVLRPG